MLEKEPLRTPHIHVASTLHARYMRYTHPALEKEPPTDAREGASAAVKEV